MKTAPELEDTLSNVTLLLEQQRYDQALSILGDLMNENPADREARTYRILVVRILMLQQSLSRRNTRLLEYLPAMATVLARAASAVRMFKSSKLRRIFIPYRHLAQTRLTHWDSQLEVKLAEVRKEIDQLREKNHDLMSEIASLSSKLAANEVTVAELQTMKNGTESNTRQLHAMNQQFQQEIATIRNEIQTREARISESSTKNQEVADRYTNQMVLSELKKGLEENQANFRAYLESNFRALEAMQRELVAVNSREKIFREEQCELKTQLAELQQELSALKTEEMCVTHKRLEEAEHVGQELREENRRFEQEIARWRERFAVSEKTETQASAVRRQLEELQNATHPSSASRPAVRMPNKEEIKSAAVWISRKGRSQLRIMLAAGVVAAAAAITIAFLGTSSDKFSGAKQSTVAPQTVSSEHSAPPEPAFETPERLTGASVITPTKTSFSNPSRKVKPHPRLHGTFETIRKTELFNGPSENAALITSIGAGMKISVVDSRNGWLEIRSKHGRPPGFLRQEAAVRIDLN